MATINAALAEDLKATVREALRKTPFTIIQPRVFTEKAAAEYLGRSSYWLRNLRKSDEARMAEGGERLGPVWHRHGRQPIYLKEDLDRWVDSHGWEKTGGAA